ncbi:MAG TPA: hypothetical protein VN923_00615, partial [Thermoanaerobaculia bacterium]|nr:hypothetical protein [Thermoanaerobaculia bacterium]
MIHKVLTKVFGTKGERDIKAMQPMVAAVNAIEPEMERKSDEQLRAVTVELKEELAKGATLDEILPRAFAAAR